MDYSVFIEYPDLYWKDRRKWIENLKAVRLDGTADRVLANGSASDFTIVPGGDPE